MVGAPVRPAEPPTTTTTPEVNFEPSRGRCGNRPSTRSEIRPARSPLGAPRGMPISTTSTLPACSPRGPLGVCLGTALRPAGVGRRGAVARAALLPEQPGDDQAVAAVVALADYHPHRAGAGGRRGHARQPGARPFHEVERGNA